MPFVSKYLSCESPSLEKVAVTTSLSRRCNLCPTQVHTFHLMNFTYYSCRCIGVENGTVCPVKFSKKQCCVNASLTAWAKTGEHAMQTEQHATVRMNSAVRQYVEDHFQTRSPIQMHAALLRQNVQCSPNICIGQE